MQSVVFSFPGNESLAEAVIAGIHAEKGNYLLRQFPDGETYVRVLSEVAERPIIVICTLNQPDTKLLPLLFLCRLLKELKAKSVCLVAPYLAYMRQDKQFNEGEAITSLYFASLLSSYADRLITVDPHLHRRASMQEIYTVPCKAIHASALISHWIKNHISNALLVGPDSESEQWVSEVARNAAVPFIVLQKKRSGDRDVVVSVPHVEKYKQCVPVLIDDIISTARTMIETVRQLKIAGMKPPVCIGVHAVFAGNAYENLMDAGISRLITCNTIKHKSNEIDISGMIINELLTLR